MPTKPAPSKITEIKLAHSPDSDDAFMFYGMATQKVRTPGLKFSHVLADIETLNKAAGQEIYDVTAFSFGAYPYLRDKYVLLDCGASFGEGYGPIVVAQHPMKKEDLPKLRIGVPGLQTSAYLALRDPAVLRAIARAWKPSLFAGFMGAFASEFWFLGFAITSAANVRTLALVEVLFAQGVTHLVFKEPTTRRELGGIVLVVAGVALLVWAY